MMKDRILIFIAVVVLILLPLLFSNPYYINILTQFAIFAVFALSLNFIVGYIGEISFGHAAYFGLGAYFTALISQNFGTSYWISLIIAIMLTGLIGMFVGFLTLRLQGVYFAIITLAFAEIFRLIISNLPSITRGAMGLSVPSPNIPFTNVTFGDPLMTYYFVFGLMLLVILFIKYVLETPFGKGVIAIREGHLLASSIGVNVVKYKVITFTISTMIAALSGGLYGAFIGILTPDLLSVHYTTEALLMVVVGGIGYLLGPLYGAFIFTVIPEFLWMSPEVQLLVFGIILLLAVLFMPRGIAYILEQLKHKLENVRQPKAKLESNSEEMEG